MNLQYVSQVDKYSMINLYTHRFEMKIEHHIKNSIMWQYGYSIAKFSRISWNRELLWNYVIWCIINPQDFVPTMQYATPKKKNMVKVQMFFSHIWLHDNTCNIILLLTQGTKKVSFTACHLGKL